MTTINNYEMERVLETPGMMHRDELEWIAKTVSNLNSWTELGVYCGRSALAAGLSLPPNGLLQLVDIEFRSRFFPTLEWLLKQRPNLKVTICSLPSVEASTLLQETDGVFVDDSHDYDSVCNSIKAWKNRCKILCGHDYSQSSIVHAGVKQAVDELCPNATSPLYSIWVLGPEAKPVS